MNTLPNKTFFSYPISLLNAAIEFAKRNGNLNTEITAYQNTIPDHSLDHQQIFYLCDSPYFNLLSQQELDKMLTFIFQKLGTLQSFVIRKFFTKSCENKLELCHNAFRMVIIMDNNHRITSIDFFENTESSLSKAA